jgi:hypothetical protein
MLCHLLGLDQADDIIHGSLQNVRFAEDVTPNVRVRYAIQQDVADDVIGVVHGVTTRTCTGE